MWRLVIGLVSGGVALAACTPTLADEASEVCYPLCRCNDVPLPAEQRDCTASCIAQFERNPPGDACVRCVVEHADRCTRLLDDCTPVCTQAMARDGATGMTEARLDR
jgi:hypothetical protein